MERSVRAHRDAGSDRGVAAVVVLYHPDSAVVGNLATWSGQVDDILVFDNTEGEEVNPVVAEIAAHPRVTLVRTGRNEGVAHALNHAATAAVARGFSYLLTMDQDSRAEPDMVSELLLCMQHEQTAPLGLVAPVHLTGMRPVSPDGVRCREVMIPMTSGSLLILAAYEQAGRFRDDFFVDFIDNEYCLRLRRTGFAVVNACGAFLHHRVGAGKHIGPFVITHHAPVRRYYKTRNRFRVFSEYLSIFPLHCMFDLIRFVKEILFIMVFESEKLAKLKMIWRGWCDFRQGRMGRYEAQP